MSERAYPHSRIADQAKRTTNTAKQHLFFCSLTQSVL